MVELVVRAPRNTGRTLCTRSRGGGISAANHRTGRRSTCRSWAHLVKRQHGFAAWDDVSGKDFDVDEVRRARDKEMAYSENMKVYERAPRPHRKSAGGKRNSTMWLDANTGDSVDKGYRRRLVRRMLNMGVDVFVFRRVTSGGPACDRQLRCCAWRWPGQRLLFRIVVRKHVVFVNDVRCA